MGFDFNGTKLILFAKSIGVDFSRTITLGRQNLSIHEKELSYLLKGFSFSITHAEVRSFYQEANLVGGKLPFVEHLLEYLGADEVDSLDAAPYEGATIIHDMNVPIKEALRSNYSVVIDGGTLEHIFNFPVSIENSIKLLRKGGHFISITPTNNFLCHGMYQFGPELFNNVLNEKNGMHVKHMFLSFTDSRKYWYEFHNPHHLPSLATPGQAYLMTIAEKVSDDTAIRLDPQQSYWEELWNGSESSIDFERLTRIDRIKAALPIEIVNLLIPLRTRLRALVSRPYDIPQLRRFDAFAADTHRPS
jgi:SAM-dependent methyltransferase